MRGLYYRFVDAICGIHDEVTLEKTRMESRAFWGSAFLCRIVPYRQLFHVQVGKNSVWEIRVRDEASCFETLDRVLERFLSVYTTEGPGRYSRL